MKWKSRWAYKKCREYKKEDCRYKNYDDGALADDVADSPLVRLLFLGLDFDELWMKQGVRCGSTVVEKKGFLFTVLVSTSFFVSCITRLEHQATCNKAENSDTNDPAETG